MLMKCTKCGTLYEVDDELLQDSEGVLVQCEACEVELVPAEEPPSVQDEKTTMLAAFDEEELEKFLKQRKGGGPKPPAKRAAPARRAPARGGARPSAPRAPAPQAPRASAPRTRAPRPQAPPQEGTPPPTVQLEAYVPPSKKEDKASALSASTVALTAEAAKSAVSKPGGVEERRASIPSRPSMSPAGRPERPERRRRKVDDDPLAAIAGAAGVEDSSQDIPAMDDLPPADEAKPVRPRRGAARRPEEPPPRERRKKTPSDEAPAPSRGEPEEDEQEPERVTPVPVLIIAPLVLIGVTVAVVFMLIGIFGGGEEKKAGPVKRLSYPAALAMILDKNGGDYPGTALPDEVEDALPVFLHQDSVRVRVTDVMELDSGEVPKEQRKGFLVKDLALRFAQEIAPYKPPKPKKTEDGEEAEPARPAGPPLARGKKAFALAAEGSVPFSTVARVLFTAQSVGYTKFYLAGQPSPQMLKGVELEKLSWYRMAPGKASGHGIAVLMGEDGFVVFDRSGEPLPTPDGDEDRITIPAGSSGLTELGSTLKELKGRGKVLLLQPGPTITYEQLLSALEVIVGGEDGELFKKVDLCGADI